MRKKLVFIIPCVAVLLLLGAILFNYAVDWKKIEDGAFAYHLTDGGESYSVGLNKSYGALGEELTIPSTFRGKPVTEIEDRGFASCTKIKRITVPASVTRIGNEAFSGCGALESVSFADASALESIGNSAFSECVRLQSIALPDGLERISYNLFYGCDGLRTVELPQGLVSIYDGAFGFCISLEGVEIPSTVVSIGDRAFTSCRSMERIEFKADGGHSALTDIGRSAFYGCGKLERIELPPEIVSIGDSAFAYCDGLISVTFTGSVLRTVGGSAFIGCDGLRAVDIADIGAWCSVGFLKNDYSNPIYMAQRIYSGGTPIIRLEIPEGVTGISARAFKNATSLVSVTLPDSIENVDGAIGEDAFRYCYKLVEIHNYSEIRILESEKAATGYISAFAKAIYDRSGESYPEEGGQFPYGDAGRVYSENEYADYSTHIYYVGDGEFLFCRFGDEITLLGYFGDECDIALPKTEKTYSVLSAAFFGQRGLRSVVIPDCVSKLSQYAFYSCGDLERVYISDSVVSMDGGIFGKTAGVEVYIESAAAERGWSEVWSSAAREIKIYYSQKKEDLPWVSDILGK